MSYLTGANVDTDESGNIISLVDYYPFGDTRLDEHSQDYENDYKFTGKEKDEDTGLYYYEARYYDSSIGRFVSRDTWEGDLRNPQTLNKYSYVANNPVKYVDPSGNIAVTAASLTAVATYTAIAAIATTVAVYGTVDTLNSVGELQTGWNTGYQEHRSGFVHTGHNTPLEGNKGLVETYPSSLKGFELTGIDVLPKDKDDNIISTPANTGIEKVPYMEAKGRNRGGDRKKQRLNDFRGVSDAEVSKQARDKSLSKLERKKAQTEEKFRSQRNKPKRQNNQKNNGKKK